MKILDLYKSILETASLVVDTEGNVSAKVNGDTAPFSVEGKRLVLPTREHLLNSNWDNRVVFHPLSENIMHGESKVMERFRTAINTKLNYVLGNMINELLVLATSVDMHKKLSPTQSEILTKLKDADEKTLDCFKAILKAMALDSKEKCIVYIFLKRGATIGGKKYSRASIISFPLYKELIKREKTVYGVPVRNRDRDTLINLLEYIMIGIDVDNKFDKGSESDIAPFLDALMRGLMGVASCINTVASDYQNVLEDASKYIYNAEWVEVFDNLSQLLGEIRGIPMQAGNEGSGAKQIVPGATPAVQPTYAVAPPMAAAPAVMQPQYNPLHPPVPAAPALVKTSRGLDFAALTRNIPMPGGFNGMQNVPQAPTPASLRAGGYMGQPQQPVFGMQNNQMNNRGGFGML